MSLALVASAAVFEACSPSGAASIPPGYGDGTSNGGSTGAGGSSAAGGNQSAAGISSIGGASTAQAGGTLANAGSSNPGGGASSGGNGTTGGVSSTGGTTRAGGSTSTGGSKATGGSRATGGMVSTGGSKATGGMVSTGGSKATGGASSTGGSSDNAFSWGTDTYSVTGGSSIGYQNHDVGAACLATCHRHSFTAGGTIYQANGTTAASNVEIGIIVNGTLYTGYSGSGGNFYLTIPGTVDWTTAQIAIRTSTGTAVHPTESGLSGNCNSCHSSSNRIVVP